MLRARAVLARLQAWFRRADDELDLKVYWVASGIAFLVEAPIFYAGGLPPVEIAYALLMSLSGALGVCMLIELWLHFGD